MVSANHSNGQSGRMVGGLLLWGLRLLRGSIRFGVKALGTAGVKVSRAIGDGDLIDDVQRVSGHHMLEALREATAEEPVVVELEGPVEVRGTFRVRMPGAKRG